MTFLNHSHVAYIDVASETMKLEELQERHNRELADFASAKQVQRDELKATFASQLDALRKCYSEASNVAAAANVTQ
jgi:hypothetical protein